MRLRFIKIIVHSPKGHASQPKEYYEQLAEQGLEGLPDSARTLVNEAMQIERENYLGAKLCELSDARSGYANGYKSKIGKTRIGMETSEEWEYG